MGEGTSTPILVPLLVLAFASIVLAAVTVHLGRSGRVTSRPGLIALTIVALAPLFGGGLYLLVKHDTMRAAGETAPGVNGVHPNGVDAVSPPR